MTADWQARTGTIVKIICSAIFTTGFYNQSIEISVTLVLSLTRNGSSLGSGAWLAANAANQCQ
jgi:hypothetical protein